MKKTIFAVVVLAFIAGTTVTAQEPASNFRYDLNYEGDGVVITQYVGSNKRLVIPSTIEGYPVVELRGKSDMITYRFIERSIAPNIYLVSVVIPESVRVISPWAFGGQKDLTSVTLPSTLKEIQWATFHGCGLQTINIPDSVEIIGKGAFSNCTNLTDANIPSGIKEIYNSAFRDCTRLTNLRIPSSIKSIEWPDVTSWYPTSEIFNGTGLTLAARRRLKELGYNGDF